ncbi:MAG: metal-dependent phosphohydrolase [Desulfobacteraceae bacterium]|nr:metal-dependent phosphohydrolase [Desulfobacteraceae bacterium]
MDKQILSRREFFKLGMAAGATAAVLGAFPKFSLADIKTVSLADCLKMTPEEMAQKSKLVTDSWKYLLNAASAIQNQAVRDKVRTALDNPAPTFMTNLTDAKNRKAVYEELISKDLVNKADIPFDSFLPKTENPNQSPHPFIAGPGSGYTSHHAYPGGVVTHTAYNTMVSLSLVENYRQIYGYDLDTDTVLASQLLHDLLKPWVFQWSQTGESRTEMKVGNAGEHHPYSVAESITRGLPPEVCVAQACAHNHPGWEKDEKGPVSWIKAACILTGKDPVKENLLSPDRKTLPLPRRMENFVCHLGDHDWVLTVPATRWLLPVIEEIAADKYGMSPADLKGKKFYQFRNFIFSQATIMTLYHIYSSKGKDELSRTALSMVSPV